MNRKLIKLQEEIDEFTITVKRLQHCSLRNEDKQQTKKKNLQGHICTQQHYQSTGNYQHL